MDTAQDVKSFCCTLSYFSRTLHKGIFMKLLMYFLRYWFPVMLWCGVIFYLSSVPSLESGFATPVDWMLRKVAHVAEYAVLTWLLFRALHDGKHANKKTAIYLAAGLALLYASSDEFHQRFVPGRQGRVRDVAVDAIGIAAAGVIIAKKLR